MVEFKKELQALLDKYNARLELRDDKAVVMYLDKDDNEPFGFHEL